MTKLKKIDKLISEINLINESNQEKMVLLENIEQENEMLKEKIELVEEQNMKMKENFQETEKNTTLSEELGLVLVSVSSRSRPEYCDQGLLFCHLG